MNSAEPRLHRVRLCRMEFFEIEVMAADRAEAFHVAEGIQAWARRDFKTALTAHRAQVLRADTPRDPVTGFHWEDVR